MFKYLIIGIYVLPAHFYYLPITLFKFNVCQKIRHRLVNTTEVEIKFLLLQDVSLFILPSIWNKFIYMVIGYNY